jgi:hypothetical protein
MLHHPIGKLHFESSFGNQKKSKIREYQAQARFEEQARQYRKKGRGQCCQHSKELRESFEMVVK